ncbi:MAG: aromatic aminobenezylarsenical efflux permease ArsG family transporter [Candidatus Krumholzibacteria bacterium]|jgi:cytochrome c biogenesis protein CcdA|nr:aromatic aminobenezylarsenical efflux permease ArsG family transporter [Candidatus Krumholzibacteria bacterium]
MFALAATALWLGILTSISPCPLATNVAAMGFIGRRTDSARGALWIGVLYTLGRALAYAGLGMLLVNGLLAIPTVSQWLQANMNRLLGPVLIVTALFLLEWIVVGGRSGRLAGWAQRRAAAMGRGAAFFLGVMFALAFCPASAALFFGSLISLSLEANSGFWLPLIYGLGTGLPVLIFGVVLAFAAGHIGRVFDRVTVIERWMRRLTGVLFLVIGVYFLLAFTLMVMPPVSF